jgi:hypothetical protein
MKLTLCRMFCLLVVIAIAMRTITATEPSAKISADKTAAGSGGSKNV